MQGALANSPDIPAVTGPLWPLQLLLRSRQTAVDARTEDGTTALMLAARLAVEDLVEELIAAQADVGASCGYVYKEAEMPDDYKCPMCGHPKEDFEPIYED